MPRRAGAKAAQISNRCRTECALTMLLMLPLMLPNPANTQQWQEAKHSFLQTQVTHFSQSDTNWHLPVSQSVRHGTHVRKALTRRRRLARRQGVGPSSKQRHRQGAQSSMGRTDEVHRRGEELRCWRAAAAGGCWWRGRGKRGCGRGGPASTPKPPRL